MQHPDRIAYGRTIYTPNHRWDALRDVWRIVETLLVLLFLSFSIGFCAGSGFWTGWTVMGRIDGQ